MEKYTDRAPWQASSKALEAASETILSGDLKVPDGWPTLINYFDPDQKKVHLHLIEDTVCLIGNTTYVIVHIHKCS